MYLPVQVWSSSVKFVCMCMSVCTVHNRSLQLVSHTSVYKPSTRVKVKPKMSYKFKNEQCTSSYYDVAPLAALTESTP